MSQNLGHEIHRNILKMVTYACETSQNEFTSSPGSLYHDRVADCNFSDCDFGRTSDSRNQFN